MLLEDKQTTVLAMLIGAILLVGAMTVILVRELLKYCA